MQSYQLAKDASSGNGGCPSIHMCENGKAAILGPEVDADTFAKLDTTVLPGERAVFLDPEVILAAADKIRAARHG